MNNDLLLAPPPRRFAAWLLDPMRRNGSIYVKVAIAAVMINLFGLAGSLFSMTVYDRVVPNDALASLIGLSIGLAIVIIFDFILRMLRGYFVDIAGASIDHEVGETMFARLLGLRLELHRRSDGALAAMMRELETLRDFFASATLTALVDVPFILLTLGVIALIGGWVVLVPALLIPVVLVVGLAVQPAMDRLSAKVLADGLGKQAVLVETVGALEAVKAAGAGPMLATRWRRALRDHSANSLRQRLVSVIAINIAGSANTISYAGVVIVGVHMIVHHSMTTGALIACSILSGRAIAPLTQIAHLLSRISATRSAYRELDTLMQFPVEGPGEQGLRPSGITGAIEFRDVGFRYPGTHAAALTGVSFKVVAGESVALLGRVGSGKSTVARLLLGLYPADSGNVLIDGCDIRQFHPESLRRHIGAVVQDGGLFSGSVRDNILLERPGSRDDELLRVADIAGAQRFMGTLGAGYDLRLTDRGAGLSGGQRQAIGIARALVGSPSLLVFDEPTSAMDPQTEAALIDKLTQEIKGRTLLLITHRSALLRLVQRVLVFEQGRIVADGAREAVLQKLAQVRAA